MVGITKVNNTSLPNIIHEVTCLTLVIVVCLHIGEISELEGNGRQPIIVADLPFVEMNRRTVIHSQISCSLLPPLEKYENLRVMVVSLLK